MPKKISPNSLKNLKPAWKPGECPNKTGRPKGSKSYTTVLKRLAESVLTGQTMRDPVTGEDVTPTGAEAVAVKLFKKAVQDGDMVAIREFADRTDGAVPKETKLSGDVNNPVSVVTADMSSKESAKNFVSFMKTFNDDTTT